MLQILVLKAFDRPSFILTTTVREQFPRPYHKGAAVPVLHFALLQNIWKRRRRQDFHRSAISKEGSSVDDDDINTMPFATLLSAQIAEW